MDVNAQIGGRNSFEFVDLPVNARVASLGGMNVSINDNEQYMAFQNPALFDDSTAGNLSLTYLPFYADVKATSLAYTLSTKKHGAWGMGLQYFSYGEIDRMDAGGNSGGTFRPNEYAIMLAKSSTVSAFTLGASLKLVGSHIDSYNAFALLSDIGGYYKHPKKDFTLGLVIKNAGVTFKKYTKEQKVKEPFDVQLGSSYKLEHMPLRLSLTAHHLQKFDIVYRDPIQSLQYDLEGNVIENKKKFSDKLIRHFVIGGEFLISKNFNVRFGYNFLRRRELRLQSKSGGAGMSLGFMLRIKGFELSYTKAYYHVVGGTNYFTVAFDTHSLFRRKN